MTDTPLSLLERWRSRPAALRELLLLVFCLLIGLALMPVLIWFAGRFTLGSYANGGLFKLWLDFLRGLAQREPPFWAVLVGPYVGSLLWRAGRLAWRRTAVM